MIKTSIIYIFKSSKVCAQGTIKATAIPKTKTT